MSFGFMMRKAEPEEMRRRTRSEEAHGFASDMQHYPDEEMRRRTRSEYEAHYPQEHEMRRRTRSEDDAPRHMGYVHHSDDDTTELRAMLKDLHHKLDKAMESGYASTKKLAPNLEGVLEDATDLLENQPKTWVPYIKQKDYVGIARMEGKELLEAIEAKKSAKDMRKELVHTIAALLQLLEA